MRQAVTTMIAGISLALVPLPAHAASGDSAATGSIAQARRLIEAKDHAAAMVVLEDLLIEADAKDKTVILDLLGQTYSVLAQQAQAAGRERDAAHYRDNLDILKKGRSRTIHTESPERSRKQSPISRTGLNPPKEEISKPAPRPNVQPERLPAAAAKVDEEPDRAPAPLAQPAALAEPPKAPAPSSPRIPPANPAPADSPPSSPRNGPSSAEVANPSLDRDSSNTGGPLGAPAPAQPAPPAPATRAGNDAERSAEPARPRQVATPEEADRLFSLKKYTDAGRCYQALARENRLPENRKNHWAYCRMVDVALRMNARPRSAAEWDQIEAEIQSIQQLAPKLWYGEYLRNKLAEVRKDRRRPRAESSNIIVRGSAPEESQGESKSPPRRIPKLFGTPAVNRSQPTLDPDFARAGNVAAASNGVAWQVLETANFRIFHCDARLAESVGETAEAVRADQAKRWGSPALEQPWNPRCEVLLYPTGKEFAQGTGQPDSAPGFSTMFTNGNRVKGRRTSLRADHPQLLKAILPHEVTHVVLADLFTVQQIPRWADEGIAVLAEPAAEQSLRASELHDALESNQVFDLSKLMSMDYPDAKDWSLYYAQSISLTRFLVEQGTPERFIQFVRDLPRTGAEAGLRERYAINGFAELHDRWRDYARHQLAEVKQPRPVPGAEPSATAGN
jgi:hypothetical protein